MIRLLLSVAAGGVAGTLLRFAVASWVNSHLPKYFPLATLTVNLAGCLVIGYLYGLFISRPEVPAELRSGLIMGFLGALTTFSSFSLDTLRLLDNGEVPIALGYVLLSVMGGLLATWGGLSLAKL
ncbi:MAG: fluoride efflux transporter CrcB [Pseudomonas sp.]